MSKRHLVLAGAGHAHMQTLAGIAEIRGLGHEVTVIGPSDYHYYSGMGPGMLGRLYDPQEIRFTVRERVERQGGHFIRDAVETIDPVGRILGLASGRSLGYDVLSCNTGSEVHLPEIVGGSGQVYPVKPIEGLYRVRMALEAMSRKRALSVAVVGGGAAGVEVAGNVAHLLDGAPFVAKVFLFAGRGLLRRFPSLVQEMSRKILSDHGVCIREEGHLLSIQDDCLHFQSGAVQRVDITILATGVHPSSFFRRAGLEVGPEGGLLVNSFLQCPGYPEIFGGGDCVFFGERPLDKVGVYAVRQNQVLFDNLKAFLQGGPLCPFEPGGDYLLIFNLGHGQGVLCRRWLHLSGRVAFFLKEWIDKRFMDRFR